jgi:hypothetical protein
MIFLEAPVEDGWMEYLAHANVFGLIERARSAPTGAVFGSVARRI